MTGTFDLLGGIGVVLGFALGILGRSYVQAWIAYARGDRTPRLTGRLGLAPAHHADTLGTWVLPGVFTAAALLGNPILPMLGWPKRLSLNPRALRSPRTDVLLVSAVGPGATLLLAALAGMVSRVAGCGSSAAAVADLAGKTLISLTVLELLPMPGRDGGRMLARFLSPHAAWKMEEMAEYEVAFVLGVFFLLRAPLLSAIALLLDVIRFPLCVAAIPGSAHLLGTLGLG